MSEEPTIEAIRARVVNATSTLWHNHAPRDLAWMLERDAAKDREIAALKEQLAAERRALNEHLNDFPAATTELDLSSLSCRERDVVDLLAMGVRLPRVAVRLGISSHTARNHCKHVFRKLGVHSQNELLVRLGKRDPLPAKVTGIAELRALPKFGSIRGQLECDRDHWLQQRGLPGEEDYPGEAQDWANAFQGLLDIVGPYESEGCVEADGEALDG